MFRSPVQRRTLAAVLETLAKCFLVCLGAILGEAYREGRPFLPVFPEYFTQSPLKVGNDNSMVGVVVPGFHNTASPDYFSGL